VGEETYCIPKHDLCPVPNAARYLVRFTPFAAAWIHLSGLKVSGEGKTLGSMQTKWTDWLMGVWREVLRWHGVCFGKKMYSQ
jgi:hypothetical protein